jgi:phage FluMu gp28-like protein
MPELTVDDWASLLVEYPALWLESLTELDGQPFKLEPYQIRFLNDHSVFRLVNKSRQIGFSTIIGGETVHKACVNPAYKANIVSINQKEAADKITIAGNLYHSIPDEFKESRPALKPVLWTNATDEISFHRPPSTSSIVSQPASAAVRGGRKDIYFDEFAHIRDAVKLYRAAMPAITRGDSRLTIISTPLGQSGLFYDIASNTQAYPEYSRHAVPWWECSAMVKPELYQEALALAATMDGSEERVLKYGTDKLHIIFNGFGGDMIGFQTEYEAAFADETTAYFTWDLIVNCTDMEQKVLREWNPNYESTGHISIGVDLAKDRDQTVFTVVETDDEGKKRVLFTRNTQAAYNDQFIYLETLIKATKATRVTIDQTGVGQKFVEDAKRLIHGTNIEGIVFTNAKKEQWATRFKGDMQLGLVAWPDISDLKRQIHGIQRTKTESNFYRFSGKSDDYFWSLMLALYGEGRVPARMSFVG